MNGKKIDGYWRCFFCGKKLYDTNNLEILDIDCRIGENTGLHSYDFHGCVECVDEAVEFIVDVFYCVLKRSHDSSMDSYIKGVVGELILKMYKKLEQYDEEPIEKLHKAVTGLPFPSKDG